jgi:hypothetical protein
LSQSNKNDFTGGFIILNKYLDWPLHTLETQPKPLKQLLENKLRLLNKHSTTQDLLLIPKDSLKYLQAIREI